MLELTDYKLKLPKLPSEQEWLDTVKGMDEGYMKEAIIISARGHCLLSDITEEKATPERLGWLSLWTKTITALSSATSAVESGSDWLLQVILRSTQEWLLHAKVLTDPIHDLNSKHDALRALSDKVIIHSASIEQSHRDTVDRLRAYAAWCLWSDLKYFEGLIGSRNMNKIWEPSTIGKEERDLQIKLFGRAEFESESDERELSEGRRRMQAILEEKVSRIRKWLSDPHVRPWCEKIEELCKQKNIPCPSFFALFGDEGTVSSQLKKWGLAHTYAIYSGGSMAIHGGTLEQFLFVDESAISPKPPGDKQEAESCFEVVLGHCNLIFLKLASIDQHILKKPELRG